MPNNDSCQKAFEKWFVPELFINPENKKAFLQWAFDAGYESALSDARGKLKEALEA
jgi:hypothetical protein